jgi:hypothetical protein
MCYCYSHRDTDDYADAHDYTDEHDDEDAYADVDAYPDSNAYVNFDKVTLCDGIFSLPFFSLLHLLCTRNPRLPRRRRFQVTGAVPAFSVA